MFLANSACLAHLPILFSHVFLGLQVETIKVKVVCEAYIVPIRCWDFDILLLSSLKIFWSAGEKTNIIFLAILLQGVKRAIFMRVNLLPWLHQCIYCCHAHNCCCYAYCPTVIYLLLQSTLVLYTLAVGVVGILNSYLSCNRHCCLLLSYLGKDFCFCPTLAIIVVVTLNLLARLKLLLLCSLVISWL